MTTLDAIEVILQQNQKPMTAREIVTAAAGTLPTHSKTPCNSVAKDLSLDLKRHGEASRFARTSPGKYTLRSLLLPEIQTVPATQTT